MGGQLPATRSGVSGLLGHDPANARDVLRVFANPVGQLETGGSSGEIAFVRDAQGRISSFSVAYVRPDGTITKTRTITRDGAGRITGLSAAT